MSSVFLIWIAIDTGIDKGKDKSVLVMKDYILFLLLLFLPNRNNRQFFHEISER